MTCSPQLIEVLRSIADLRAEFPDRRGPHFDARVRAPRVAPSTRALARAMVSVCDECGISIADVVENESLRDDVIDAALPAYFKLTVCGE